MEDGQQKTARPKVSVSLRGAKRSREIRPLSFRGSEGTVGRNQGMIATGNHMDLGFAARSTTPGSIHRSAVQYQTLYLEIATGLTALALT